MAWEIWFSLFLLSGPPVCFPIDKQTNVMNTVLTKPVEGAISIACIHLACAHISVIIIPLAASNRRTCPVPNPAITKPSWKHTDEHGLLKWNSIQITNVISAMVQIFSWSERWNVPFNEAKPSWMVHFIYHRIKTFVPLCTNEKHSLFVLYNLYKDWNL